MRFATLAAAVFVLAVPAAGHDREALSAELERLRPALDDPARRDAALGAIVALGREHRPNALYGPARGAGVTPALVGSLREGPVGRELVEAWSAVAWPDAEFAAEVAPAWRQGRLEVDAYRAATLAFADRPDPAAAELMRAELLGDPGRDPIFTPDHVKAARYFARLDAWPTSATVLLAALDRDWPEDDEWLTHTVRVVAAEYLGRVRFEPARDALLRVAAEDPFYEVRAAALGALARLGGPDAVVAAAAQLTVEDAGQASRGHEEGDLADAAVDALATLDAAGEPSALPALYNALRDSKPRYEVWQFWLSAGAETVGRAEALFAADPLPDAVAARWLGEVLFRPEDGGEVLRVVPLEAYAVNDDAAAASLAEAAAPADRDAAPEGGEWVQGDLQLFRFAGNVVALRSMGTRYPNPARHDHGETQVWLRPLPAHPPLPLDGGEWRMLGDTGGWVE